MDGVGKERGSMMYTFEYVTKSKTKPVKRDIIELISLVQNEVTNKFSFQFRFIGSESRNMVTWNPRSNIGFDFDVNIYVNDDEENYTAKEIKNILMCAFNKYAWQYGYDFCENSTRVFTIKVKDKANSRILHSCDFAVVYDCADGRQQYIRFHKPSGYYSWEYQPKGFYRLPEKIAFCKKNGLWQEVRELYLQKKSENKDLNKKSRNIFAETVHQICQVNGFYD